MRKPLRCQGKKYFETPLQLYIADAGLRNAILNFRRIEENPIMENVIFNERKIRGYSVDAGIVKSKETMDGKRTLKQLEIDFAAGKGCKKSISGPFMKCPRKKNRGRKGVPFSGRAAPLKTFS